MKPEIKFISYNGSYPTLCMGTLVIEVEGERFYLRNVLRSGGGVFNLDSGDYCASEGEWSIDEEELPEKIRPYIKDIELLVNDNVEHGCCGGCI